jgi:hypothetical protein
MWFKAGCQVSGPPLASEAASLIEKETLAMTEILNIQIADLIIYYENSSFF